MNFDIITLVFVLSLILITQVVALFVQFRVNKTYIGIGHWLLGSGLLALGSVFIAMINVKSLEFFVRIANSLVILGHIFLYLGVKKFLNRKLNKWLPISIFIIFNIAYYYYMFIYNDIAPRTVAISVTITIISFLIAYELLVKKDTYISSTANFISAVFFLYGCFHIIRTIHACMVPSSNSYDDQRAIIIVSFFVSILISNLWTLGLIIMVNQRLNIDNKLEKEKFTLIFNTNMDAQLITRLEDGFIVDVNDEFSILTGYSKAEVIGRSTSERSFWTKSADRELFIAELNDKKVCENMEFIFRRKDKSQFAGMISARIITIQSITHIISVVRDITERKEFEKTIIESEETYRSILNASPDDITITDLEGGILMISPAAKAMFGYELEFDNFIGMQLLDFIIPEDVERAKSHILKMHEGGSRGTNEYRGIRQDQSIFDIEVSSGFIYNANGLPDKMVFIVRDITERKLIELKMQKLIEQLEKEKNTAQLNSITDSLTRLYNRGYFDKTLRTEFFRLMPTKSMLSLIMLDIDYFKKFNDNYGHLAGDHCIQKIATTLQTIIGWEPNIVARYGEEEFIAILPETDENGVKIMGEKTRKTIEELAIHHSASDISKYVTVSVGVSTVYPADLISPEQALKLVDEALYSAKEKGRNCCVYRS